MSVNLRILSNVYDEVTEAFLYYDSLSHRSADKFLESIDFIYDTITQFPLMYQVMFDNVHRAPLTKFPYAVFYKYYPQEVVVFAVRNTKQDPQKLPRKEN